MTKRERVFGRYDSGIYDAGELKLRRIEGKPRAGRQGWKMQRLANVAGRVATAGFVFVQERSAGGKVK